MTNAVPPKARVYCNYCSSSGPSANPPLFWNKSSETINSPYLLFLFLNSPSNAFRSNFPSRKNSSLTLKMKSISASYNRRNFSPPLIIFPSGSSTCISGPWPIVLSKYSKASLSYRLRISAIFQPIFSISCLYKSPMGICFPCSASSCLALFLLMVLTPS